jgi:hypothetical protein
MTFLPNLELKNSFCLALICSGNGLRKLVKWNVLKTIARLPRNKVLIQVSKKQYSGRTPYSNENTDDISKEIVSYKLRYL